MEITNYSTFRNNLKEFIDMVISDHIPLYIKRSKGDDVVLVSKADYDGMQETIHLLKHPKNATRLLDGIKEYEKGGGEERTLLEE